jgi:hypothetical protein
VTTAGNFDGSVSFTPPGGTEQALEPGWLVDVSAIGNIAREEIHFTMDGFEQSADQQGTPLGGLAILRQKEPSPEPIPTSVTPPSAGRWVGIRENLGGAMIGSPTVASWGENRLDVFVRGLDNALWHKYWDGGNWSNWESLGGVLTSSPAAVSWGPNRIDVFVLGGERALLQKSWDGSSWRDWVKVADLIDPDGVNIVTGDPAAASWGPERLDVFLGYSTDNGKTISSLYHMISGSPGTWGGGDSIAPVFSAGSAVSRGVHSIDVVTHGPDGQLYHYQGSGDPDEKWNGPFILDYYGNGRPVISSWGANRLDLFIQAGDLLFHRVWDGSTWSDWEYVDSPIYSAPAAVSWATDRIDVFAAGKDGELLHYWYAK